LQDNKIKKAEALIRWLHPERGIIGPADFIPIAEESGLIHELGDWVFHQALQDLHAIQTLAGDDFQLSINVSPFQFNDPEKLLHWINEMSRRGIPGASISFEITERLLLEPSGAVIDTISKLRKSGMELSIDDFGTGYSALAYLKKFDIDYVKIDKSFIQNLAIESYDAVLCESIIHMARKLNIQVIAEGIETESQKKFLREFGCHYGQGYLFSKPVSLSDFINIAASK